MKRALLIVLVGALGVAGCGGSSNSPAPAKTTENTVSTATHQKFHQGNNGY